MAYEIKISNNFKTVLTQSVSATGTQLYLQDQTGLPYVYTVGNNGYIFYLTITNAATLLTREVVKVVANSGTYLTVVRNQQGTTSPAEGWPAGSLVAVMPTQTNWENFTQFGEFGQIPIPVGGLIYWPSTVVTPSSASYIICSGASLSTTTYSELFSVIGYTYGGSGGVFQVPSYRTRFLRGASIQRPLGTFYADSLKAHTHFQTETIKQGYRQNGANAVRNCAWPVSYVYTTNTQTTGNWGNFDQYETRPINIGLDVYIRYV